MKKFLIVATSALLAGTAYAADLGVINQAAPIGFDPVVKPATDWTGFYAGIFGGVSNGPFDYSLLPFGVPPSALDVGVNGGGLLGGIQLGYDVQFDNNLVIGAVADIALTSHRAEVTIDPPPNTNATSQLSYLGTVRARLGYAFDDNDLLAYVHGGVAYGRTDTEVVIAGVPVAGILSNDRWGYSIGAGVEYAVTEKLSFQTEYAYTNLGTQDVYTSVPFSVTEDVGFHTVKAGLNFRF